MKTKKLIFLLVFVSFSLLWGVQMVKVRGNSYTRGDNAQTDDLFPEHKVKVNSFYISKYEVTQKLWNSLMGRRDWPVDGDDYPVSNVSWWDAVLFCNKLSEKEGLTPCYDLQKGEMIKCNYDASGYRLPSEAEWELAAIGGNDKNRNEYSGSLIADNVGWIIDTLPHPVGQKSPNSLGIYDMTGNVNEWCNDWYDLTYYRLAKLMPNNPKGANYSNYRVIRGGGFTSGKKEAGVAFRNYARPSRRKSNVGFRIAKSY